MGPSEFPKKEYLRQVMGGKPKKEKYFRFLSPAFFGITKPHYALIP
jgi:hypothetical protein